MSEYDEIKTVLRHIVDEANETKRYEEASECLRTYRIIGEIIKQHYVGDLKGSPHNRSFNLCGNSLKIEVFYGRQS